MWNPFKSPPVPRSWAKRLENLELRSNELEDSIEKVLYQQTKMMGKINARHKQTLAAAEEALEAAPIDPTAPTMGNELAFNHNDPKAQMRAQAAMLRRR